jgi:cell wall-associated NlpC family hydrolase
LNPLSQNHLKKSFYILSLIALFASCKSSSVITSSSAENNKESANQIITEIVNTASENIVQYKTAGTTKAGYDCSGLVYSSLAIITSNFRTSYEQSKQNSVRSKSEEGKDRRPYLLKRIEGLKLIMWVS